jgi:hypothetical protein
MNPRQDYVAARWQEWKPTYSVIEIDEHAFTVNTYETDTGKKIDETYTIVKTAPAKTADATVSKTRSPTPRALAVPRQSNVLAAAGSSAVRVSWLQRIEDFYVSL